MYVAAVSPARDENASYVAWGHSMAIDPWFVLYYVAIIVIACVTHRGKVIGKCDHTEGIVLVDIGKEY